MAPAQPFETTLAAAQRGAPWACEALWRRHAPGVAGYLRLRGARDVEDLTSEVFLGAFRSLGSFRGDERELRSWLLTIAHHRLVDARRRAACRPRTTEEPDVLDRARGGDVEEDALARLGLDAIRELCGHLAPRQRDVLLLRTVGDLTVSEVARAMGTTVTAVKSLQHRAVVTLRAAMVGQP